MARAGAGGRPSVPATRAPRSGQALRRNAEAPAQHTKELLTPTLRSGAAPMARPSSRCRTPSLRSLAAQPEKARAQGPRKPSVRPCTRCARPGAGDGWQGEREGVGAAAGSVSPRRVHVPRRSSNSPVHVPRHGLIWHPGCYGSAHNRPLWPMAAQTALRQVCLRACRCPPRPPERGSLRHVVIRADCALRHGSDSGRKVSSGARERTKVRAALPRAPVSVISPALRASVMAPPRPGRRTPNGHRRRQRSAMGGHHHARRQRARALSLRSFAGRSPRRPERRGCPARPRRAAALAARRATRPLAAPERPPTPAAPAGVPTHIVHRPLPSRFEPGFFQSPEACHPGTKKGNPFGSPNRNCGKLP